MVTHHWIRASSSRERAGLIARLDLPPVLAVLDAHRRLRGPYTAGGTLLRRLADDVRAQQPELWARHNVEILTCAPELAGTVPAMESTLEWRVAESERTRFYSRLHTRNIANGIAELLRDHLVDSRTLIFDNVHEADPTDQELVAVLLRRGDLGGLVVVVGTGVDPIPDPRGPDILPITPILNAHATPIDGPHDVAHGSTGDLEGLAQSYIDSDGTADDPDLLAAYRQLPAVHRAALHDRRAEELRGLGEFSLSLGAIPFHVEHGSDPANQGAAALRLALDHCRNIGLYQAAVDFGLRGMSITDRSVDPKAWWTFAHGATMAMSSLGRADEAEAIFDEVRAVSTDPGVQMRIGYGMAMLHARHYPEAQRDYDEARRWMNLVIAVSTLLPDPKESAFHSVFGGNGLALIEVRQGRPDEALRLLNDGMARLDRELEPDEHVLHRAVLRYNRGQVYAATGRLEEALADYTAAVTLDPDFPEHHFNIGTILRKLGRTEEAVAAYARALELSPPFPEAYYNLGDAHLELGDEEAAIAEFSHAIELEPEHIEARINRAELLCERGALDAAWSDISTGLELAPDNVYLLCLKGRLLTERGDHAAASHALSEALRIDANLTEAWAIRAEVAHRNGHLAAAISDLERALDLADTPELRFNRALLYEEAGRFEDAIADYDTVLSMTDDADAILRRESCLRAAAV